MKSFRIPIPNVDFDPPIYYCKYTDKLLELDGHLNKPFWEDATFSQSFRDIEGANREKPRFLTRVKMLWDNSNFYIGAELHGPEIWANITQRDDVIFQDNDFEIFIDPDSDSHNYYEFEMNVINTVWDLFLSLPYRDGGSALNGYDIKGLQTAVYVDGTPNCISSLNRLWSAEIVIPFASITELLSGNKFPNEGDFYRVNFSRVHWNTIESEGQYIKKCDNLTLNPLSEENWVWAPTGVINIHYPELWGYVFFVNKHTNISTLTISEEEYLKWDLRKLYYAQHIYYDIEGRYTNQLEELKDTLLKYSPIPSNSRIRDFNYKIETTSNYFEISTLIRNSNTFMSIHSNGQIKIFL